MLEREEYVEQAYFFRTLRERMAQNMVAQELITAIRDEILATTKLPLALDFLSSELRLIGTMAPAMARLPHYFTTFQTYIVSESERDTGRFDFLIALEILEREANYRASGTTPQGSFMFQFECLCRNRLSYDRGLEAMAGDPIYDERWAAWMRTVRRQIGLVDFADLIYVRSEYYRTVQASRRPIVVSEELDDEASAASDDGAGVNEEAPSETPEEVAVLFGEKEGRIALANRRKDPLFLFAALQRQLGYPSVPRPKSADESKNVVGDLLRKMTRLELRVKLLEEEEKGGIDITKFYGQRGGEVDGG